MKTRLPLGLLLVGMFVAGCNTPENMFNAGDTPIGTKPVAPVKPVKPATPAKPAKAAKPAKTVKPAAPPPTTVLIVPPQKPKPSMLETNSPVVVVNAPPVIAPANPIPAAPVVVPDDATPAPTKPAEIPTPSAATLPRIVTPDTSIAGKVVAYNAAARFAVMSFPAGPMPAQDQSIFLYRGGMKVGEIKITGPQRDNNTVGDVINGDAQVGDEVRDR